MQNSEVLSAMGSVVRAALIPWGGSQRLSHMVSERLYQTLYGWEIKDKPQSLPGEDLGVCVLVGGGTRSCISSGPC